MKKFSFFVIGALLISSCSTQMPNSNNNQNNSTSQNNQVTEQKPVSMTLTTSQNGVENPLGPEEISSVVVNGVTIPASEIVMSSKPFSTKAESSSDYQVTYEGAGKYIVVNKTTGKALQNRALIIFNLLNSKTPAILPILQGLLENNIRMTIDLATGDIYGGVTKEDGTIDNTKPVFKIGTDGKMTVTSPDGKQTVYSRNDSNNTNLPEPEKTVDLNNDEVKKQMGEVVDQVKANSPIAEYVGLWLYQGLGQKIILQVRDKGNNKFDASATVDKKYTGEGNYNPNGKNDTLTLKVDQDQMHIEVAKVGSNALTLTLKSTSNQNLKVFQNAPVNLQRVRVTE